MGSVLMAGDNPELRLSWNTTGSSGMAPEYIVDGWRAGSVFWLGDGWERFVLVATAPVPEPSVMFLTGGAVMGLLLPRRRRTVVA